MAQPDTRPTPDTHTNVASTALVLDGCFCKTETWLKRNLSGQLGGVAGRQLEDGVVHSTEVPGGTLSPCAETLTARHLPALRPRLSKGHARMPVGCKTRRRKTGPRSSRQPPSCDPTRWGALRQPAPALAFLWGPLGRWLLETPPSVHSELKGIAPGVGGLAAPAGKKLPSGADSEAFLSRGSRMASFPAPGALQTQERRLGGVVA